MLVATRDPLPHDGAQDAPRPRPRAGLGRPAGSASGAARFMTVLQVAGSLLAIPVGLVSAYSMYRANFSVETTCQSLRSNIVGMIDKQIDAGTRRMLVRRDVESFEKTCAAVDPEAVAAFKKLLTVEKAPVAARTVAPAKEAAAKETPRKAERVELRPSVPAKPAALPVPAPAPAKTTAAAAEPAQHEAPVSDTKWLAAVRGALVAQTPERAPSVTPAVPAVPAAEPLAKASVRTPAAAPAPVPQTGEVPPAATVPAESPAAAPALPPPTAIVSAPAQPAATATDHPVPPAGIPEVLAASPGHGGSWVGKIPFVGQMLTR